MGPLSHQLRTLTYCVFVGVWIEDVGFVLEHPEALPPKSVSLVFTMKDQLDDRRAWLAVSTSGQHVLVPFPSIDAELMAPSPSTTFARCREHLESVVVRMVDSVNVMTPGLIALARA